MNLYEGLIKTIEVNGGHIDVYKNSLIFYDDATEKNWEYEWKDLYRITKEDNEMEG